MFEFKTEPYSHQKRIWADSRDRECYGIFAEMGTGKTKMMLDTATWLYNRGKIDGVLVVAPNGVQRNWIEDEIPIHVHADISDPAGMHFYEAKKASTQKHKNALDRVTSYNGLAWLAISYDAFITEKGKKAVWDFLRTRRVLYILDESTYIKTPGAKRTKSIIASSKYAPYRRILTGTPVTQGPFDIYSQIEFLDNGFWKQYGLGNYFAFKNTFGVFRRLDVRVPNQWNRDGNPKMRSIQQVVDYKNLDWLSELISSLTVRVLKEDVLDLPPKLYQKRYFDMSTEQKKLYHMMRESIMMEFKGGEIDLTVAMVKILRLQQITSGYLPSYDENLDEDILHDIDGINPRLETLVDICSEVSGQAIIFGRFRRDIELIKGRLGKDCVTYDGTTSDEDRARAKQRFQEGDVKFFVANPAAAGRGLTLHAATTVIYYTNSFALEQRLQSEDRAHRIGQHHPVNYIDIIASGTVDMHIVKNLRNKVNIAATIIGDTWKEWI